MQFAVPTLTCTITACARPRTVAKPCAIDTAAFSCGAITARGLGNPSCSARAKASTTDGKSVPELANRHSTPCCTSRRNQASATLRAGGLRCSTACAQAEGRPALHIHGARGPRLAGSIDIVVNPLTPRIVAARPAWTREFHTGKIGRAADDVQSVTLEQMLAQMDAAGIERAFLVACKLGQLGTQGAWHMPEEWIAEAVAQYPDRFHGLAGIDPTEGM